MRILFATVLLFAGLAISAQDTASEGGPKITFENPQMDLGDVEKGKEATTVFKFKNTGDKPLTIANVQTSCGCTSAAPEKNVYNPGESGEISVTFYSTRFVSEITKRVTVYSNDQTSPQTVVSIKANVVVDIDTKPSSLVFAKAKVNETSTQELTVSTSRLERLEISEIVASPEFLKATMQRIDERNIKIIVSADGSKFPDGKPRITGTITFKTNSETQPEIKAIASIIIARPIRVSPNSVYFFASKKGVKRESPLRLLSTENADFNLEDIATDLDFIKAEVQDDGSQTKKLLITLNDNAPEGRFEGMITLKTTLPSQPEVKIPVRGNVVN